MVWKKRREIFHSMENFFPQCGKSGDPSCHHSIIPLPPSSPGALAGIDGPADVGDGGFAEAGLEAGEDFGLGGAAELEEPAGVGDVDGEEFVFEVGGPGVGGELGADDFGPGGGDLRDLGMGGEFHALEDVVDEGALGDGVGGGVRRLEVRDLEAFAVDLPAAFVVGLAAVHRGILAEAEAEWGGVCY